MRGEDRMTPFCEARHFFMIGDTIVKFDGVSLLDLDNKKDLKPHQLFGFVMEALLTRKTLGHDRTLSQNQDSEYFRAFPNIAKNQIEAGSAKAYALNTLPETVLTKYLQSSSKATREAAQASQSLMRTLKGYIKDATAAFINPRSNEHSQMMGILEKYMALGRVYKLLAVHTLLSGNINRMADIFRASKQHTDSDLHQQVADSIYEYAQHAPGGLTHIPAEDLDFIFSSEPPLSTPIENLPSQMGNIIKSITHNTSTRTFSADTKNIDWGGIVPANSINLDFDKLNPSRFKVTFEYENDQGETLNIWLTFDTKKDKADWSVLETPYDSSELKARFIELTQVSISVLRDAASQAQILANQRAADKAKRLELTPIKPVDKGNVLDYLTKPRDLDLEQLSPKQDQPQTPIQGALEQGLAELTNTEIRVVNIPDSVEFAAISKGLSTEDREGVLAKLKQQNERGVGHIKRLRSPGANGKPRYSYRIGNTRVILQEVATENKSREFKIVNIAYRKNVYNS